MEFIYIFLILSVVLLIIFAVEKTLDNEKSTEQELQDLSDLKFTDDEKKLIFEEKEKSEALDEKLYVMQIRLFKL